MIQKISFQNYKAFERGEIKIKPITILLGANSVGKSSIINLLLMLQQTANSTGVVFITIEQPKLIRNIRV